VAWIASLVESVVKLDRVVAVGRELRNDASVTIDFR
jgi:hypothetical protein